MKAAISGLSGFIGGHLSKALSARGYQIVRVTQELMFSPAKLRDFFNLEKPDYIFHLAAYGNKREQGDPAMTAFCNFFGTFNMLNESLDISYRGFINFGSSSEYGQKDKAMSESDILDPQTLYGASKAGATHLASIYASQYGRPIVTIRPFSVYGPNEADNRFIPTVIRSMVKHETFMLDEKANHDWIFISDFLSGVFTVMDKLPHISSKVINLGTGRMHSNKEVCDILKKISGFEYLATFISGMRKLDSQIWISDNTLIQNLGFYPQVMLEEGLRVTFNFYKERYRDEKWIN